MSDTKALIKYVRDRLNDGPNITFGKPTARDLIDALEAAEARAEKAESDKAALEEDLEATEKNLKEFSGFIEELLSGLKHRFPVQYADLEGDEYGDDAFSSHDLFQLVIDPAVNVAQKAEAENARLTKMVDWLAKVCAVHCSDKCTDAANCSISHCLMQHCRHTTSEEWKEAARRAVAAGEGWAHGANLFTRLHLFPADKPIRPHSPPATNPNPRRARDCVLRPRRRRACKEHG